MGILARRDMMGAAYAETEKGRSTMATSNQSRRKDGAVRPAVVIGVVGVVLLVSIVAFGGVLAMSANRALEQAANIRTAYMQARESFENGNYEAGYAQARSAVDGVSGLSKELEAPQWNIAAALPVLGTDVQTAREMSSIAGKLADEGVSPVFNQWDSITNTLTDDTSSIEERASALPPELSKLGETLDRAKQVVYECEERAGSLPETHFDQLNDAAGELKSSLSAVGDILRSIERMSNRLSSGDYLGMALDGIALLKDADLSGLLDKLGAML